MKISIIGVGLIGGSLGLSIRRKYGDRVEVTGYDSNKDIHGNAKKIGAVDNSEWNLDKAVAQADLIILSTPANTIYELLETISKFGKPGVVVMDTASTKRIILDWADEILPDGFFFVGTNPFVGSGFRGQKDANADLFSEKRFAVTVPVNTPQRALKVVTDLIKDIGAKAFFMDIDEHDSFSAAVNCVPTLLAASLMTAVSDSPAWREINRFIGSEFQELTQSLVQEPATMHAASIMNPEMTVHWLDEVLQRLNAIKESLMDETKRYDVDGPMADLFVKAWEERLKLDAGIEPGRPSSPNPLPTAGESMAHMFLGRLGARMVGQNNDNEEQLPRYDRRSMR